MSVLSRAKKRLREYAAERKQTRTELQAAERGLEWARRNNRHPRQWRVLLVKRLTKELGDWQSKIDSVRRVIKRHSVQPWDKAVDWAVSKEGITERPPGSNRGPYISTWQRRWLGFDGYAWCGAFVGKALDHAGVKGIDGPSIVYTPSIRNDAIAGRNGFTKLVPLSRAKKGDLVLMDFSSGGAEVEHVGMAREDYDDSGKIKTAEGNTTSDDEGDQSNGGGVFLRERPASVIVGCARPRWP